MMTEKYTINDIFTYEGITRDYCVSKGRNLSPRELIMLASMEEEFNVDYAFYIQFKHTHQLTEFIRKRDPALANSLRFISEDIMDEDKEFETKLTRFSFKTKPSIFDILDAVIRERKWDLVFYLFQNESVGLHNLISKTEDERNTKDDVKNKKFFILQ